MKAILIARRPKSAGGSVSTMPGGLRRLMGGMSQIAKGTKELDQDMDTEPDPMDPNESNEPDEATEPDGDEGKISPEDADYVDQAHACGSCERFSPPNVCRLVAGPVSESGYCALYREGGESYGLAGKDTGSASPAAAGGAGSMAGLADYSAAG